MAHVAALRAHGGDAAGRGHGLRRGRGGDRLRLASPTILERHGEKLRADAIVLADSTNWAVGEPALTTTLRGMIRVVVTVRALDHGIHSGMFGGAVPDAHHRPGAHARLAARRRRRGRGRRPASRARPPTWTSPRSSCARTPGCSTGCRPIGTRLAAVAALDQAVDHDDRHRRPVGGHLLQHPGADRRRQGLDAARPRRGPARGLRGCWSDHLRAHAPWGVAGRRAPRRRGRRLLRRRRRARSTTRRVPRSPTPGACRRSTSAWAGRSRSWRRSPRSSRTPRSWSPASRTPTRGRTAPTRACTSASSSGCASPRRVLLARLGVAAALTRVRWARPATPVGARRTAGAGGRWAGRAGRGQSLLVSPGSASIWSSATRAQRATSGSTVIWLTTRPCDQRLQRPDQVRQVDPVHRRAVADVLLQEARSAAREHARPGA